MKKRVLILSVILVGLLSCSSKDAFESMSGIWDISEQNVIFNYITKSKQNFLIMEINTEKRKVYLYTDESGKYFNNPLTLPLLKSNYPYVEYFKIFKRKIYFKVVKNSKKGVHLLLDKKTSALDKDLGAVILPMSEKKFEYVSPLKDKNYRINDWLNFISEERNKSLEEEKRKEDELREKLYKEALNAPYYFGNSSKWETDFFGIEPVNMAVLYLNLPKRYAEIYTYKKGKYFNQPLKVLIAEDEKGFYFDYNEKKLYFKIKKSSINNMFAMETTLYLESELMGEVPTQKTIEHNICYYSEFYNTKEITPEKDDIRGWVDKVNAEHERRDDSYDLSEEDAEGMM